MMYDTIVTDSPYLNDIQIKRILEFCDKIEKKKIGLDKVLYEFIVGDIPLKSYDYRIRIKMCDYEFENINGITKKIQIKNWYVKIECSIHKMICGMNVVGGPQRIKLAHKYLIKSLEEVIGVKLPESEYWTLERIDVTSVYDLKKIEYAKQMIDKVKMLKFPRRSEKNIERYDTAIAWNGSVNYHKHYLKHPEFLKHDYKVLKKRILYKIDMLYQTKDLNKYEKEKILKKELDELNEFTKLIKGIYRVETGIRKVKINELFKELNYNIAEIIKKEKVEDRIEIANSLRKGTYIGIIKDEILFNYGSEVLNNLFKDVIVDMKKNDSMYVMNTLIENYKGKANTLFATWTNLNTFGYEYTKKTMNVNTFYRHVRDLRKLNIGWNDLKLDGIKEEKGKNINVVEFYDYMINNLEIIGECKEIENALNSVA